MRSKKCRHILHPGSLVAEANTEIWRSRQESNPLGTVLQTIAYANQPRDRKSRLRKRKGGRVWASPHRPPGVEPGMPPYPGAAVPVAFGLSRPSLCTYQKWSGYGELNPALKLGRLVHGRYAIPAKIKHGAPFGAGSSRIPRPGVRACPWDPHRWGSYTARIVKELRTCVQAWDRVFWCF